MQIELTNTWRDVMKMKIVLCVLLVLVTILAIGFLVLNMRTVNIELNQSNIERINIIGFGSITLDTKDKTNISNSIKYFNSISYLRKFKRQNHNNTPDASLTLYDKDGKEIDKIEFYGDLVEYNGEQYKVFPFMNYDKLEKFCNSICEK